MIGWGLIMTEASYPVSGLPLARCLWPTPLPSIQSSLPAHTPYSTLYTLIPGLNPTTAAFKARVLSFTSPDGSIGAPTTIVAPRR